MTALIPCPPPGLYHSVPAAVYFSWDALSNSTLTDFAEDSPAHHIWRKNNPKPSTEAQIFGTACHSAILEPEQFLLSYFRGKKINKQSNAGKEAHAAQLREAAGRILLEAPDYDDVLKCRDAVMANPKARKIIESCPPQMREVCLVWDDKLTGIRCKARLDLVCDMPSFGMIADLKSTVSAQPSRFSKAVYELGYHRQAVQYLEGLAAHDMFLEHFVFIAFEKDAPFVTKTYRLDDDAMILATEQRNRLLVRYAECADTGIWPGYGEHLEDIGLPRWAQREIEKEIE